ncbi:MAG: transposase family protein [Desulfuromonadaceae bacterium]
MSDATVKDAYKISELVEILGVAGKDPKRALRRKLDGLPKETRKDETGNDADFFITVDLPAKIQMAIVAYEIAEHDKHNQDIATAPPERPKLTSPAALAGIEAARKLKEKELQELEDTKQRQQQGLAMFMELPEPLKQSANAKAFILDACKAFLAAKGYEGRTKNGVKCWSTKGVEDFCTAFVTGQIEMPHELAEGLDPRVKRKLTYQSIMGWKRDYETSGLYGLANLSLRSDKKGQTCLSVAMQELTVSMKTEKPGVSVRTICKAMAVRFKGEALPNRSTVGRFLDNWKASHESLYLYLTNPDQWKNRYMFAFGDASENVTRLNQRWEADSTPADIMCSDGRACIIGIIDVWSRRFKMLVSPTSKSVAIGMLLRRCILDWGMVEEEFRTDNGADYTSFYMERVLDFLGADHHLCPPFTPESKPHIERALGLMSHGILPLLDGYIGHSVAERKAIESRKSFAKRLMTRGETVEIKMTSSELQTVLDRWCEAMYHTEIHSSLGMSPLAKVRSWTEPVKRISNEHALDVLLSPAPSNDGWRVITKKGCEVTFGLAKLWYKAAEFAGHEGERVRVLIDVTDLGHATIFQADGSFLCVATDPTWHGISNAELASHTKQRQKALLTESRRNHKEMVKRTKVDGIAEEILQDREEQAAKFCEFPKQSTEYTTPALEQAALAVDERTRRAANPALNGIIELPPEVLESEAREAQKVVHLEHRRKQRLFADQYEISEDVRKRMNQGKADEVEIDWLRTYEHYVTTGKQTGRFADDPYLLKHWQQAEQAVGQ